MIIRTSLSFATPAQVYADIDVQHRSKVGAFLDLEI